MLCGTIRGTAEARTSCKYLRELSKATQNDILCSNQTPLLCHTIFRLEHQDLWFGKKFTSHIDTYGTMGSKRAFNGGWLNIACYAFREFKNC